MRNSFVVLVALSLANVLFAQSEPAASESITVDITNVDVVVTDAQGNRVRGLTKDDFEIYEGKKKREITNFLDINGPQQSRPSARILLMFDESSLTITTRKSAVAAARRFLAEHVRPIDRVMIATMTRSVTPKVAWTSDPVLINKALDAIEGEAMLGVADSERKRGQEEIRRLVQMATDAERSGNPVPITFDNLIASGRGYASRAMHETSQTISALAATLNWFPSGSERKVMVLIGEGLQLRPGVEIFEYLNNVKQQAEFGSMPASIRDSARRAVPLTEASAFDVTAGARALAAKAYKRGVAIYPLAPIVSGTDSNPTETRSMSEATANASNVAFAITNSMMTGYQLLARETGATPMIGKPADAAMEDIAADLTSYYSLAYRGAPPADLTALVVKSKKGYAVRATLGGIPASVETIVKERVVAHHIEPVESNDMHVGLQLGAIVAERGQKRVPLRILIPVKSLKLENEGAELVGGFTVFISTGDARGDASEANAQTQQIRWPATALQQMGDKTLTFAVDVLVSPPRTQISIGVIDQRSKQTGYDLVTIGG